MVRTIGEIEILLGLVGTWAAGLLCAGALASANWPNEPAGATVITDDPFNSPFRCVSFCGTQYEKWQDSAGWWDVYRSSPIVQSPNGRPTPFSPPGAIQWNYTTALNNSSPGTLEYSFGSRPTKKLYSAFWFMVSNNFAKGAGVKLSMNFQGDGGRYTSLWVPVINVYNGQIVVGLYATCSGCNPAQDNTHILQSPLVNPNNMCLPGNVRPNYAVTPGEWHQIEMFLQVSTSITSRDGVARMWVDGNLVMSYTNVNFESHPFFNSQIYSSYHGTPPDNSMYIWYDHVRVSDASTATIVDPVLPTAPAAPTHLTATTKSSSQVDLTWTDNSSNETGFVVERRIGPSGTWSTYAVGANVTSYSVTGLGPTTFYFRVKAVKEYLSSAYSNEVSVNPSTIGVSLPVASAKGIGVRAKPGSVRFTPPQGGEFLLSVYDLSGREVWNHTGSREAVWNHGGKIRKGVYLVKAVQNGKTMKTSYCQVW